VIDSCGDVTKRKMEMMSDYEERKAGNQLSKNANLIAEDLAPAASNFILFYFFIYT
jgi:hypothetical protein